MLLCMRISGLPRQATGEGLSTVAVPAERSARALPGRGVASAASRLLRMYTVRRAAKALLTIYLVATFTFFLIRLLPGNPVDVYINTLIGQYGMSYQDAANQAAGLFAFHPNQPLVLQYLDYLRGLAHGDFGKSLLSRGTLVTTIIKTYLPWTLFSAGVALLISFSVGVGLGMVMAYKREGPLDHVLSALGSILKSVPNYLLAIMIVVFLGVQLEVLPITDMRGTLSPGTTAEFSLGFLLDALFHAALPIATYVLSTIGAWMLIMKSSTLATLEEDYVTVARARGLSDGRNAVLPLFSQLAIAAGFVVGGSVLIEPIFQYQGVGYVLLQSVLQRDYPVMQGIFVVITSAVVVSNLLADLLYSRLDPRIRITNEE